MEKKKLIGLIAVLLIAFQACGIKSADDGSSMKKAIVIKSIGDHLESIGQEYKYIGDNFGDRGKDWVLVEQRMIEEEDRFYDLLTIKIIDSGEEKILYFDITEPFRKLQSQLD